MKKNILLLVSIIFVLAITNSSCKKPKTDPGCGCNTDSVVQSVTDINAQLGYVDISGAQLPSGWYLTFPRSGNFYNLLKICNENLPTLKLITDTLNHANYLNVKFSGKATDLCASENWGASIGYDFDYHVIVTDIKKQ